MFGRLLARLREWSVEELARGALIVFVLRVSGTGAAFAAQVLLARWIGAQGYGAFAYAYSAALVLSMVAGLGLPTAAVRFIPQYVAKHDWPRVRGALRGYQAMTLLFAAVVSLVAYVIFRCLLAPGLEPVLAESLSWAAVLAPPLALIGLEAEQCRALGRMMAAFLCNALVRPLLLIAAVAIAGLTTSFSAHSALLAAAAAVAATALVQHMWTLLVEPRAVKEQHCVYEWGIWMRVALPLLLISGFFVLLQRIDIFMLGSLVGARETAHYNAASRTATIVGFFYVAVCSAVVPRLSRLYGENRQNDMQTLLFRASRWALVPTLLGVAALVLLGRHVLDLFGDGFASGGYVPLVILAGGHLINAAAGPVGEVMNISGLQNRSLFIYAVTTVANIILNSLLIPRFGATGAAFATLLSMACWNVAQYVVVARRLRLWGSFLVRPSTPVGSARE